jgi:hypothetical protein
MQLDVQVGTDMDGNVAYKNHKYSLKKKCKHEINVKYKATMFERCYGKWLGSTAHRKLCCIIYILHHSGELKNHAIEWIESKALWKVHSTL